MRELRAAVVLCLAATLGTAAIAAADEVTFKGSTLHGQVVAVTAAGVEFQPATSDDPEFPASKVAIPYESITDLRTDDALHILSGDDRETVGRILGLEKGALFVGTDRATAERIPTSTIVSAMTAASYDGSLLSQARTRFRYWKASADLGFSLTRSKVDTTGFGLGLNADRKKAPSRVRFAAAYRQATQKETGDDTKRTQDDLTGLLRGDYDVAERLFAFASADTKYDGIQRLSVRAVPKLGLGYFLWKTKRTLVSAEAGGAYIYERYFGGDTNDFFSVAFGGELETALPYDAAFRWRVDYLPSVKQWADDYLVRNDASLVFPILDFLAFKASLIDDYDNTPAANAKRNSLATLLGLSVTF